MAYKFHQDVSDGNVMVTRDGRGILNDWETAATVGRRCVSLLTTPSLRDPYRTHGSVVGILVFHVCSNASRSVESTGNP